MGTCDAAVRCGGTCGLRNAAPSPPDRLAVPCTIPYPCCQLACCLRADLCGALRPDAAAFCTEAARKSQQTHAAS
jgi:hypothetical protein